MLVTTASLSLVLLPAGASSHADARHATPASASAVEQGDQTKRSRIVVGFRGLTREQRRELVERLGAALRRHLPRIKAAAAEVPADRRDEILQRLREQSAVEYAEVDRPVALGRPRLGSRLQLATPARTPSDDGFSYQYSLRDRNDHDVDATNAWERRTSCSKVAVIDTGVATGHKDLKKNLWHNDDEKPDNGKDHDGNGYVDDYYGLDLVRGKGSGVDKNGHGTHVAGIITARGNNDRGVSGPCWKSHIISVRTMDVEGRGYTSDGAEGIVYAVRNGARVINASYGASTPTEVERRALAYAAEKGAVIVAAAGNDHRNADTHPSYPAAYPDSNVISVAATDDRDRLASFSNYGKTSVDLGAPGDGIASTYKGGEYRMMSGTSMAAPLVAAAAAMLRKQASPSISRLRTLLLKYADDKDSLKGKVASGGRLNIRRSLNAAD